MIEIDNDQLDAFYNYYSTKIGIIFAESRIALDISQENAKRIGYSRRVVQHFERKNRDASITDIVKMILTYNLDPNEVLRIPENHLEILKSGYRVSEELIRKEIKLKKFIKLTV